MTETEKIEITICTGTTCYVMGGAELLPLEDHLPAETVQRCSIRGASCLGLCRDRTAGAPPFVKINNKTIPGASLAAVIAELEQLLPDTNRSRTEEE